jgi:hypothetical protein
MQFDIRVPQGNGIGQGKLETILLNRVYLKSCKWQLKLILVQIGSYLYT